MSICDRYISNDIIGLISLNSIDSGIEIRVGDFNFKILVFSDCFN